MEKSEWKFAIVIDETLSAGPAINLASHLSTQLGTTVQDLGGADVLDASGVRHGGLPVCPNVILAASPDQLRLIVARTRESAVENEILALEYPEEGFSTATDDEYRTAVALVPCERLTIRGILLYGLRRHVNAATKGLALWK